MKLLNIVLILVFAYLIYIALFTNKSSVCEPLIDLVSRKNQLITFKDLSGNDYVMIRLEHIKNSEGQPDRELISQVYSKIPDAIPDFDTIIEQSSQTISENLKLSKSYIKYEPVLLVKISDIMTLTKNAVLTASISDEADNKTILTPFDSSFLGPVLNGEVITDRIFGLNQMLFLNQVNKTPLTVDEMSSLYLHEIHDHNGVKIFILKTSGNELNKINLLP